MLRDKLLSFFNKSSKILIKSNRLVIFVLLILVISYSSFSFKATSARPIKEVKSQTTSRVKITTIPTPTQKIYKTNIRIFGEVTDKKLAPRATPTPKEAPTNNSVVKSSGSSSSGDSGLISSINNFRAANGGIAPLSLSSTLCDIAGKRFNELLAIGTLDNHAGFEKYFKGQNEFSGMGEVLFQSSNLTSPEYAVNEGWAKSKSGHRENMLNPAWSFGCGATNGHIAVFNFGKR